MSLLKNLVQEMAAGGSTAAHSIATTPGSLFSGGVVDPKRSKKKQRKMMRRIMNMKESLGVDLGTNDFDASDVISKIASAQKREDVNSDTTPFGLEDEDGNLIKVYVKTDQADDFEKQLALMLAGADEDDDNENNDIEIAEVLFQLKDKFDIVNVEWPNIDGDEEEEQEVQQQPQGEDNLGGGDGIDAAIEGGEGGGGDDLSNLEGGDELNGEEAMTADETGAESALQQVIDMMKADAEAKQAEAEARTAEAKAKEAEYTAMASSSKVRKEEQIFDMEAQEKQQKEQKKEAEQLSKLARYQHGQAQNAETKLSMESDNGIPWKTNHSDDENNEDEDEEIDDKELTLKELSYLIMRNLRHN